MGIGAAALALVLAAGPLPEAIGMRGIQTVEAAAKKPKLSKSKVTVNAGFTATATLKNVKKGKKVKWTSSNKKVATVKGNKAKVTITGKKAGKATVTAKYNGKKYKIKVTVKKKPALSDKSLTLGYLQTKVVSLKNVKSGVGKFQSRNCENPQR